MTSLTAATRATGVAGLPSGGSPMSGCWANSAGGSRRGSDTAVSCVRAWRPHPPAHGRTP